MDNLHLRTSSILMDIEAEMHRLNLWAAKSPSEEAFTSDQPFFIDTMTFPEWIQFVFLPRMHELLEAEAPLPESCQIAPMAEVYFAELQLDSAELTAKLQQVDELLSTPR